MFSQFVFARKPVATDNSTCGDALRQVSQRTLGSDSAKECGVASIVGRLTSRRLSVWYAIERKSNNPHPHASLLRRRKQSSCTIAELLADTPRVGVFLRWNGPPADAEALWPRRGPGQRLQRLPTAKLAPQPSRSAPVLG